MLQLIQFKSPEGPRVGRINGDEVEVLDAGGGMYGLASRAIESGRTLAALVGECRVVSTIGIAELEGEGRLLPPVLHPEPARFHICGTGLTHLGSAEARAKMHESTQAAALTDTMRLFQSGLKDGRPAAGKLGVTCEWFYKGNQDWLVPSGQPLPSPAFALDAGEEPEIVGLYIIDGAGNPRRIGFALGNEFTDHVLEKENYLYLGHAKLRNCSIGAELLVGDLPAHVRGRSVIRRGSEVLWDREFLSGEDNMSHTLANIEGHHFKYAGFRRPGDLHALFFGTATASFSASIRLEDGDEMEISAEPFRLPLKNRIRVLAEEAPVFPSAL